MTHPPTPPTDEAKTIAAAYAALNAGDVDAFLRSFDPQVVRREWVGSPAEGEWRGIDAVRAHVEAGRGTWAEGGCEPTAFVVNGDRVLVRVHVRVRLRGRDDWAEGDVADVFIFREGRVIEFRSFEKDAEALAFAGLA